MRTLTDYLEYFALASLEKQDKLDILLGEYTYGIDLEAGMVRFNDNLEMSFQVLGTESDNTLTWLWAWADEQTEEIPVNLLQASRELRNWGLQKNVPEFSLPSLDLHMADGHALSMIACGLCSASSYFRDAYEGGSAYFLLFDKRIDAQPLFDLSRLSRRFRDLISRYEFKHRQSLRSYLGINKLPMNESDLAITSVLDSGEQLIVEFNDAGQLARLNGEALPDIGSVNHSVLE